MITRNIGGLDRVIRIMVGLGLGYVAFITGGIAGAIMGVAAGLSLVTGIIGWCGIYMLLGVKTCNIDKP